MSLDFCLDCGMLLSPYTGLCAVCGFDNNFDDYSDISLDIDHLKNEHDNVVPENYSGF